MVHTHQLTMSLRLLQPVSHTAHNGHAAVYIVSPLYTVSHHMQRCGHYYILKIRIHVAQMKCCVLYHLKVVRGWWASHYFGGNGLEVTGVHTWHDMIIVWTLPKSIGIIHKYRGYSCFRLSIYSWLHLVHYTITAMEQWNLMCIWRKGVHVRFHHSNTVITWVIAVGKLHSRLEILKRL